ncbi:hypothetical protein P175DRAFT_0551961 [Aspergillus ochraceoroseus IBT 24754]|uniref:Uncharacterized protein n=1 Tax=Aspergillus ochraceoroseus IBT 24754 TaxID=1392256 RepID=A0A2T5LPR7_9EURO|nr:uncharacterized protein P175DRAFT_0551961 [Aspergillus ochraceoroseus IBT 24754]PTU18273.1 hypothetical protein P175DRAFT_0551961 [Aspergillus ochraceoroseus IBT 24754]
MNGLDLRSSLSSYGDPRHFSTTSFGVPQPPPTKVLLDGYRNALDTHNAGKSQYSALNLTTHPHHSVPPLNPNDPVAMYLLTETAMGDSLNYEILSLEEVEGLKRDYRVLSSRTNTAKRKLALELKLRDAAMSLSRLHNHRSPRTSDDFEASGSPNPNRDKTEEELALSNRKCEELAMEIWNLERKVQETQRRLLEHTAGVLQLTHKGLKKNPKNGIPHTPESLSSNNTMDDFDDRSLYKTSDHLEDLGGYGERGPVSNGMGPDTMNQNAERKLEYLSARMRDMIVHSRPDKEYSQVPQPPDNGAPINPSAMVEAHLTYIENGLSLLASQPRGGGESHGRGLDDESAEQIKEMSAQLLSIMENPGLPRSRTLPQLPGPSSDLTERLSYLNTGISGLHEQIEKLLDQKSILTTQIQQQRELNSKSDAERDAHIADLIEQLAHVRKELELSERQGQQSREDLDLSMQELEDVRRDLADHQTQTSKDLAEPDKDARAHAEAELERLQNIMEGLQHERDEHHETRVHAEGEVARLESVLEQLRSDHKSNTEELTTARSQAEGEVARLESMLEQLQSDHENHTEELTTARSQAEGEAARLESVLEQLRSDHKNHAEELTTGRSQAEDEVARLQAVIGQFQDSAGSRESAERQVEQLEETIHHVRNDADSRVKEASDMRIQAESEVSRLEATITQLRTNMESQLKEVDEARSAAEENASRLQVELTHLEGEVVRVQTELTMVKAELDGAYGTRAQRAAEAAANPALQREFDELNTRNIEMALELAALKAGKPGGGDAQNRVETLEKELRETVDDYEAMTKASIEFEKERERFESIIDGMRDRCEYLETQLNEERISWMGLHSSASSMGRDGPYETTSTMVLKNEFKKMMRDTRAENMKILKAEQEERRRLETIIRNLKKEHANLNGKSGLGQTVTAL